MNIKYIKLFEELTDAERTELAKLGLASARWHVELSLDYFHLAQNEPADLAQGFTEEIIPSLEIGATGYLIEPASVEIPDWDPEDHSEMEESYPVHVSFVLETQTHEESIVRDFIESELLGRVFDGISELEMI